MKIYSHFSLFLATLLCASAGAVSAAEVKLSFDDPESFTDLGDGFGYDRHVFERFRNAMQENFEDLADRYLPDDATLEIEFQNVDLAGEVEPWRPNAQNTRIVREIYPPSMKFHFRVTDASGEALTEGLAQLTDLTFTWNAGRSFSRNDPFFYEKELVDDWGRKVLRPVGNASARER